MASFRGTFDHTLDAKNRLTVPARYREEFERGAVLAQPWDGRRCVSLWRPAEYEDFSREALATFPPLSPDRTELERFLFGRSQETELDRAGRVMVPAFLIKHAKLVKDVIVLGVGNRLELWSRDVWDAGEPAREEDIAEVIARANSAS